MTLVEVGRYGLTQPGVYDVPEAEYHADPVEGGSASSTVLRKLLPPSCPALARHAATHPEFKNAYDLGSVTHRLVLGAGCEIVEVPADSWSTKAAKEARAEARSRGAVALLSKDLATAVAMRDAVHRDDLARAVLTMQGAPERTLVWQDGVGDDAVWCRAMLDRWPDPQSASPLIIGDLKTTDAVDADHLHRTVWNYGYHQQEDLYRRGYLAVHNLQADFLFIFVQKDPPHLVRTVQLDDQLRSIGRARNDEALAVWRACRSAGQWPGYGDDITLIGPPSWARNREDY